MAVTERGVVVSAPLTGLTSNYVYSCKALAMTMSNGTTCDVFNETNATVTFSFKTSKKAEGKYVDVVTSQFNAQFYENGSLIS